MPATLKELMRHADINTTMTYYVQQSAQVTASELWAIRGTTSGTTEQPEATEAEKAS